MLNRFEVQQSLRSPPPYAQQLRRTCRGRQQLRGRCGAGWFMPATARMISEGIRAKPSVEECVSIKRHGREFALRTRTLRAELNRERRDEQEARASHQVRPGSASRKRAGRGSQCVTMRVRSGRVAHGLCRAYRQRAAHARSKPTTSFAARRV